MVTVARKTTWSACPGMSKGVYYHEKEKKKLANIFKLEDVNAMKYKSSLDIVDCSMLAGWKRDHAVVS